MTSLALLQQEIVSCTQCPRLLSHCKEIADTKRRAYRDWTYWGKPVPSFGDPRARLLIVGLAPGAHGANRTGRVFTGDSSGDFLYRALFQTGFATQPQSVSAGDSLELVDAYISIAVRCAPPGNKPLTDEFERCRPFFERELSLLPNVRVVVALGRAAFDTYLKVLENQKLITRKSAFVFGHNRLHTTGPGQPLLISSFHPSQQNTFTGRLTEQMLFSVFDQARKLIHD